MLHMNQISPSTLSLVAPVVTQALWASMIGLTEGAVQAAVERHYWPVVKVGRHKFINVEAVRLAAIKKAEEYSL
jgi:hypothetical protein